MLVRPPKRFRATCGISEILVKILIFALPKILLWKIPQKGVLGAEFFFLPFTGPLGTRMGFFQKFGDPSEEVDKKLKMIQ